MLPCIPDLLQISSDLLGTHQASVFDEHFRIPQDRIHRGTQFMTHVGEKNSFSSTRL